MDGMIFAAGLGTRLRPLTNDRPKALVALNGQTLLERTIGRLKAAGVERQSDIRQSEALAFLDNIRGPFDLVLLDPPYHRDILPGVLTALQDKVAPGGVVLAESERGAQLPEQAGDYALTKTYFYGKAKITAYRRQEEA